MQIQLTVKSFGLTEFLYNAHSICPLSLSRCRISNFWSFVIELNRPIHFDKQMCKQKKLPRPTQIVYADATPWQIEISILHKDRLFDQSIPLPWLYQSQAELLAAAYAAQVAKYGAELRVHSTWIVCTATRPKLHSAPLLLLLFFLIRKKNLTIKYVQSEWNEADFPSRTDLLHTFEQTIQQNDTLRGLLSDSLLLWGDSTLVFQLACGQVGVGSEGKCQSNRFLRWRKKFPYK